MLLSDSKLRFCSSFAKVAFCYILIKFKQNIIYKTFFIDSDTKF